MLLTEATSALHSVLLSLHKAKDFNNHVPLITKQRVKNYIQQTLPLPCGGGRPPPGTGRPRPGAGLPPPGTGFDPPLLLLLPRAGAPPPLGGAPPPLEVAGGR